VVIGQAHAAQLFGRTDQARGAADIADVGRSAMAERSAAVGIGGAAAVTIGRSAEGTGAGRVERESAERTGQPLELTMEAVPACDHRHLRRFWQWRGYDLLLPISHLPHLIFVMERGSDSAGLLDNLLGLL
jgi:hypothetical protein